MRSGPGSVPAATGRRDRARPFARLAASGSVGQGYCPICERFWRLPAGGDVSQARGRLEAAGPRREFPARDGPATRWVTVATFGDALKAKAPRIRLEAEGIPTFVEGARMGSHSMYPVATGGVRLQVPQPLAADARVVLSQTWAPVAAADDLDDAWDELAPEPGAVASGGHEGGHPRHPVRAAPVDTCGPPDGPRSALPDFGPRRQPARSPPAPPPVAIPWKRPRRRPMMSKMPRPRRSLFDNPINRTGRESVPAATRRPSSGFFRETNPTTCALALPERRYVDDLRTACPTS